MKQIVMLLIVCCLTLSISGCTSKIECVKPTLPNIPEAKITQCKHTNILDNAKCSLQNYIEIKQERDSLRATLENMLQ